jgi:hypothetical protein
MRRVRHVLLAAIIGIVVVALSASVPRATRPGSEEHSRAAAAKAIDALDRCVQDRFVRIDKGFGMSRVSVAMHNTRLFVPVNESESRAIRDFETLGMRVVMYVASRQRPRYGPLGAAANPPLIQGPVLVSPTPQVVTRTAGDAPLEAHTDPQSLNDLPNEADVRAQGVQSLKASDSESRDFEIGRWSFVARPVRASASACLNCHNNGRTNPSAVPPVDRTADEPFRLGDPLGAVLYGYRECGRGSERPARPEEQMREASCARPSATRRTDDAAEEGAGTEEAAQQVVVGVPPRLP